MQARGNSSLLAAALLSTALLMLSAAVALPDSLDAPRKAASNAGGAYGAPSQRLPPLERLKARSAETRWRELNGTPAQRDNGVQKPVLLGAIRPAFSAVPGEGAAPATSDESSPRSDVPSTAVRPTPVLKGATTDRPAEDAAPEASSAEEPAQEAANQPEPAQKAAEQVPQKSDVSSQPLSNPAASSDLKPYAEPVRDPGKLKKLTDIFPYDDYEPDPEVAKQDRCRNLCPRPAGTHCPDCLKAQGDSNVINACPECPDEVRLTAEHYLDRNFPEMGINWEASDVWSYPLYTEDVPLERYGHTRNRFFQPFFSIGKFGVQVVGIPYQMVLKPPRSCVYPLGLYRPGDCVPYMYYQIPLNLQAAAVEAGVIAGAYFLFVPHLNP